MAIDPVLAFLAVARMGEVEWNTNQSQLWFMYVYEDVNIISILEGASIKCLQADGVEVE